MSCFHTIQFSYEGCTIYVHYYSSLFNGRIHTNIHLFIHVIQSLFFSLFFLCMLVIILSSKTLFPVVLLSIISHRIDLLFLYIDVLRKISISWKSLLRIRYMIRLTFSNLLLTFWQDKATHISNHIQEWRRRKRLIKSFIPPEFLLKWFLKSLLPYIAKDVSTSRV